MGFDLFTPVAIVLAFTFLTTLRFSIEGTLRSINPILRFVTHPAWLYPLIISGAYTLGAFYHDKLSPWPLATYRDIAGRDGMWAGLSAALAAATADIWLLWATATTFRVFNPPEHRRMIGVYYAANLAVGGYLMARFFHVIHVGGRLITG